MENVPYFHDTTFIHQFSRFSTAQYGCVTLDIRRKNIQLLKKKKKSIRSLKNICVYHMINAGIRVKKDQVPDELLEYIRLYLYNHRNLIPTFSKKIIPITKLSIVHMGIPWSHCSASEEYSQYIVNNSYWVSDDFDRRLNFHVTSYIKRSSNFNYMLRKCPHIDMPFLNGY